MQSFSILMVAFITQALMMAPASVAQPISILNPSFESGDAQPHGWTLSTEATGYWQSDAASHGRRSIALRGDGNTTSYWRSAAISLAPLSTYALKFYARSLGTQGGSAISGPRFCNRDLGDIPEQWTHFTSIFSTPSAADSSRSFLRFGQWQVRGELAFDDVRLVSVQPIYRQLGNVELGAGERIQDNLYTFSAPFNTPSRNHSRPLTGHNCDFNTNRWVFGQDSSVEYRHAIHGHTQHSAQLELSTGYFQSGELAVEASIDGVSFAELGRLDTTQTRRFDIPDSLLPASEIWIRLRSSSAYNRQGEADPGAFQVVSYAFRAELDGSPPSMRGQTHYAQIHRANALLDASIHSFGTRPTGRANELTLSVYSHLDSAVQIAPSIKVTARKLSPLATTRNLLIQPGAQTFSLPYTLREVGPHELSVTWDEGFPFNASIDFAIPALYAATPGQRLPGSSANVILWQIDSGWKVDRHRPPPSDSTSAVYLSAAAGESEAVQLVISPSQTLHGVRAEVNALYHANGDSIGSQHIDVLRVGYVPIDQPTDAKGIADSWPDPLLPLIGPAEFTGAINHPLWLRFNVPATAAAGLYRGNIALSSPSHNSSVPIELEVYDFALPSRMSCSTALGFSFDEVVRYHRLTSDQDKRRVLDLYLDNFARHRISPYNPAPLDPFGVSWNGSEPIFDWSNWDEAMQRAIDDYGFNSFRLPLAGLGGGDYAHRRPPMLNGVGEDDPRYEVFLQHYLHSIEKHLERRGWLDEAFIYFFDEPQPQDYAFVNAGFAKVARHAPSLRRMLTEQVEEALVGGPTIWCPLTPNFDGERARARRAAGESFWWYICTLPKEPYAGLFIDRPGIELRTWLWQTWQHGIEGILIWQSNYWHSDAAYTDDLQNPYDDPMSWVSSYSTAVGDRRPWGNGDGRFIYPPPAVFSALRAPVLAGPVDSQRWEMLRDGIEDYEYFAQLERLLNERNDILPPQRERYQALLKVPEEISTALRSFGIDPAPLRAHRHALARAIEQLQPR